MDFANLEAHVATLGGVRMPDGSRPRPPTREELRTLAGFLGEELPEALKWWFGKCGVGFQFVEPVVYTDPAEGVDVLVDGFLSLEEIRQTLDDLGGALAPQRLPLSDDGFGNFLVVTRGGAVAKHYHDAPLDRNERPVAESVERFLLMLRRGE